MLEITMGENGVIRLAGRLDAAQAARTQQYLDAALDPRVLDLGALEYISSAGLGALLRTQKRLMAKGGSLRLVNANPHVHDIFRYSGFDRIFEVERAPGVP